MYNAINSKLDTTFSLHLHTLIVSKLHKIFEGYIQIKEPISYPTYMIAATRV